MRVLKYLPRFRRAYAAMRELEQFCDWSRGDIEAYQLENINRLWKSAIANVSYYVELRANQNLPSEFSSLAEFKQLVPVLGKDIVRDNKKSFLSVAHKKGRWLRTGGSTGLPVSVFWSHSTHFANLRLRYAWMLRQGVDIFDSQAFIWGHAGSFSSGLKGRIARIRQPIEDQLRNRFRFSAYKLGNDDLDRCIDSICKNKIRSIYGYSSAVDLLARRAIETGNSVASLRLAIMTGEAARPNYKENVFKAFRAPGRIEYGSVECGILALENDKDILEVQENSRMIETVERDDGRFDIVATVLDNPCFPLFRFLIGDVSSDLLKRTEKGFATLKQVLGRNNDYLVSRDGGLIHANAVKHALENVPGLARFQAEQDSDGSVKLIVEQHDRHQHLDNLEAIQRLKSLLGGFAVDAKSVDSIPGNLAGKHVWVTSKLFAQLQ